MTDINPCRRCGRDAGPGVPRPNSCTQCPPVHCTDCDESDDRYCPCWISLEGLPLADIKGLLAIDGLTVDPMPGSGDDR